MNNPWQVVDVGRRVALAEVGQRPARVADERGAWRTLVEKLADVFRDACLQDAISVVRIVSRHVSQAPNRLLLHLNARACSYKFDQSVDNSTLDKLQREVGLSTRDVG